MVDLIHNKGVGVALMKTDLRKYYRQIYIDPGSVHLVGFRVAKKLYWDITLSMGLTITCYIAQHILSAIIYIYGQMGYSGLNYISNLAAVKQWSKAYAAYNSLLDLLQQRRIWESTSKQCEPDIVMSFLGILANSVTMVLLLTLGRLLEIKGEMLNWSNK